MVITRLRITIGSESSRDYQLALAKRFHALGDAFGMHSSRACWQMERGPFAAFSATNAYRQIDGQMSPLLRNVRDT